MGLDTVELVLSVEKFFEITIPDEVAVQLNTVGKLHQFIVTELNRLGRPDINADIVFSELRTLICHHLDVNPEDVLLDARFVQDLGAD